MPEAKDCITLCGQGDMLACSLALEFRQCSIPVVISGTVPLKPVLENGE